MPDYLIDETVIEISRRSTLVDTNILVAAFCREEEIGRQEYAQSLLHQGDEQILVAYEVMVEAWGVMVGKNKDRGAGCTMLRWINDVGQPVVVIPPAHRREIGRTRELVEALGVDCVDAMLADLATDISRVCDLRPTIAIATFDTRDFTRLAKSFGVTLRVRDGRGGGVEYEV